MKRFPLISGLFVGLLMSCSSDKSAELKDLPTDFAAQSDTAKIGILIDRGIGPDSIAHFVAGSLEGKHKDVTFRNLDEVEAYIFERMGNENATAYTMSLEIYIQQLPLDVRYRLKMDSPLTEVEKLGYELGLEFTNQVINQNMTKGQVDHEVANLRRACGDDEETYEHFLTGLAAGLKSRPEAEVNPVILESYGK